jgi:hypothetical protein
MRRRLSAGCLSAALALAPDIQNLVRQLSGGIALGDAAVHFRDLDPFCNSE